VRPKKKWDDAKRTLLHLLNGRAEAKFIAEETTSTHQFTQHPALGAAFGLKVSKMTLSHSQHA
jgi:hypothetical protein